jgi:serine/threonine-protein kinase
MPRHGRILTPDYASPEQLEGAPITTATAVYALRVVLSELLASDRPFCSKSGSYQQPVDAVLQEAPRPPVAMRLSG